MKPSVLQSWVVELSFMQQSVLLSAIRGPDGIRKKHPCKDLIRYYRRCLLISAFDKSAILNPYSEGGGSFTGPVENPLFTDNFMQSRDELPFHYWTHFMHAAQIMGAYHNNENVRIFWSDIYARMVNCMHLNAESTEDMKKRLGGNRDDWLARCDEAGSCST